MADEAGMSFGTYLANGFKTLKFDKQAVEDIVNSPNHKKNAFILITIISAIVGVVLALLLSVAGTFFAATTGLPAGVGAVGAVVGLVGGFIGTFIALLISCGLVHIFAKLLKGNATIMQYFAADMATVVPLIVLAIVAEILGLIPFLGMVLSLIVNVFSLVVGVFVVREAYKFSTGRAIAAVLIPVVVVLILVFVLAGAALLAVLGTSGMTVN